MRRNGKVGPHMVNVLRWFWNFSWSWTINFIISYIRPQRNEMFSSWNDNCWSPGAVNIQWEVRLERWGWLEWSVPRLQTQWDYWSLSDLTPTVVSLSQCRVLKVSPDSAHRLRVVVLKTLKLKSISVATRAINGSSRKPISVGSVCLGWLGNILIFLIV